MKVFFSAINILLVATLGDENAENFLVESCNGFMTVLAPLRPWVLENESCVDSFYQQDESIALLSSQMVAMNATLTVYSGYQRHPLCNFAYPNIFVENFDSLELLQSYSFGNLLATMSSWYYIGYTRASDILRILLALRHRKTYIDTDIHFLTFDRKKFMRQFVGAAMWGEEKAAIEITNSAFCLSEEVLLDMTTFLQTRIATGKNDYFYTELGPSMFHKVLLNKHAVALYSQNHPEQFDVGDIVAGVQLYSHSMLHFTGFIRLKARPLSLVNLVTTVRTQLQIPPLVLPISSRLASRADFFDSSYQNLQLMSYNLAGWYELSNYLMERVGDGGGVDPPAEYWTLLDRLLLALRHVETLAEAYPEVQDSAANAILRFSQMKRKPKGLRSRTTEPNVTDKEVDQRINQKTSHKKKKEKMARKKRKGSEQDL